MNVTEVIIFLGLAAVIVFTQVGRRPFTIRRVILPLVIAGYAAYHYLQGIPTAGGDLDFEMVLAGSGALLGLLAASIMRVERDTETGHIVTQGGIAYAVVWLVVLGGRLGFAWAAQHLWQHQLGLFSIQHAITGTAAWTAAFVLMALAMVITRTLVITVRAYMTANPPAISVFSRP